ncbi:MAG TPA: hypothetical protein VF720_15300 [Candidatus Eisenbacteria bacterium]
MSQGGKKLVVPAVLFILVIIGLSALDARLKGPVASSRNLEGKRTDKEEALAERAFLNAQLALAASDSINIVLDARTNHLWIVMKGVKLRECKLSDVQFDANIRQLVSGGNEALWLERPFILAERRGSLPDPWQPVAEGAVDTLKGGVAVKNLPMNGALVFDRELVLHIRTPPTAADSLSYKGLAGMTKRWNDRLAEAGDAWAELTAGPASMDVYLHISREDAAAVLRALSVGGGMALRI